MDDELNHILFEIDDCFDRINKQIYHIQRYDGGYRSYAFSFDYLDHYIWLINQLSTYTRALDHKLEESYKVILENRDNGDME